MNITRSALTLPIVILALAAPAQAATITVNTEQDELATDGACSLREAISAANLDSNAGGDCATGAGADTIELPAGLYRLSIAGAGRTPTRAAISTSLRT